MPQVPAHFKRRKKRQPVPLFRAARVVKESRQPIRAKTTPARRKLSQLLFLSWEGRRDWPDSEAIAAQEGLRFPQRLSQPDGSVPTERAGWLPSLQLPLPRSLPLAAAPLRPFCAGIQLPGSAGSYPILGVF